jgi:hypothetical protein
LSPTHVRCSCVKLLRIVFLIVVPVSAQQTLYNGIVLPPTWPPVQTPTQTFQVPTYITNPPSVIPIDVGRQLFVDDFLIQQTTMTRVRISQLCIRQIPLSFPVRQTLDS